MSSPGRVKGNNSRGEDETCPTRGGDTGTVEGEWETGVPQTSRVTPRELDSGSSAASTGNETFEGDKERRGWGIGT